MKLLERKFKNSLKKAFSIISIIIPVLNNYSLKYIPGSLSDFAICVLLIIILISYFIDPRINYSRIGIAFSPYLLYIIISFLICCIMRNKFSHFVIDYFRQILIFMIVIFGIEKCSDYETGKKSIEVISILSSIYCWIQLISMQIFRLYLPSYIPFFEHMESLNREYLYENYTQFYRPHSIFPEPSIFCEYILVYLTIILFEKNKNTKNSMLSVFITLTCMITGSTTGILGSLVLWSLYLYLEKGRIFVVNARNVLIFFSLLISVPIITKNDVFQIFFRRVFLDNSSVIGRFGHIPKIFGRSMLSSFFGEGFAIYRILLGIVITVLIITRI